MSAPQKALSQVSSRSKEGLLSTRRLFTQVQGEAFTHSPKVRLALRLAATVHKRDVRHDLDGDQEPYIAHPLRVTLALLSWGVQEEAVLAAALLHATLEKHAAEIANLPHELAPEVARIVALGALKDIFGSEVAALVEQVSRPVPLAGASAAEKQLAYQAHVRALVTDERAFLIKLADYLDNVANVSAASKDRKRARSLAKKYLPLADTLAERLLSLSEIQLGEVASADLSDRIAETKNTLTALLGRA